MTKTTKSNTRKPLSPSSPKETCIARLKDTSRPGIGFGSGRPVPAVERGRPILLPDEAHIMTMAPTGAGKTVSCTVPTLLQYPGPVIVLDPKGEHAAITARRRRELGQQTFVLDPFGVTGLATATFNPLDFVEPDTHEAPDEAAALAGMLMPPQFDNRDVFWRNRAMHFLTAAILHAVTDFPPGERNLATVRDIVHRMARMAVSRPTDTSGAPQAPMTLRSRHPDVERINEIFALGASETVGGMLHTALEGIGFVRGLPVEISLQDSSFSLDDVTEGVPMTIYLVVPPHLIPTHGVLLRLWLGTLFYALMRRRGRPSHATLLLLDEAAQLGPFAPLRTALTLLRGYGVQTWSFWQDPGQLAHLYPGDWRSMINNCRIVQFFGAHSQAAWGDFGGVIGADLHDFRRSEQDLMVVHQDGELLTASRLDYRNEPTMRGQFDPNPIHQRLSGSLRRPKINFEIATEEPMGAATGQHTEDNFQSIVGSLKSLTQKEDPSASSGR